METNKNMDKISNESIYDTLSIDNQENDSIKEKSNIIENKNNDSESMNDSDESIEDDIEDNEIESGNQNKQIDSRNESIEDNNSLESDEIEDEEYNLPLDSYHTLPFRYTFLNKISKNQILIECNANELLEKIPVWDKQRIIQENHVLEIINYQENYYKIHKKFNFIGVIYICGIHNKNYAIIDGQHRLVAIYKLAQKYPAELFNIMVWVSDVENENKRIEMFQNINLARPISIPDLILDDHSDIINKTAGYFFENYKNFFVDNTVLKPRRPNMKLDTFKNELYESDIIEKLQIKNVKELIHYINQYNTILSNQSPDEFPKNKSGGDNEKVFNVATRKGKLYLGLYPNFEWINYLITFVKSNKIQKNIITNEQFTNNVSFKNNKLEIPSETKKQSNVETSNIVKKPEENLLNIVKETMNKKESEHEMMKKENKNIQKEIKKQLKQNDKPAEIIKNTNEPVRKFKIINK